MSNDDDAAAPAAGGEGADATLHIRSSSVPDNSWSPAADGQGAGPTRPSPKPQAPPAPGPNAGPNAGPSARPAPAATPRPAPAAPRTGSPAPGTPGSGPGRPGSPGTAPGGPGSSGAVPGGPGAPGSGRGGPGTPGSGPGARPGNAGSRQGFGAVSALSTPDPIANARPEPRDKPAAPKAPRKAHLVLRRVEPWSAMKFSFVVSLVCFVVLFVAVAVLYGVLSALGVFDSIVNTVTQLTVPDGKTSAGIDIKSWFEPVRILGYTALLGAVNVVLITALSTLGAVIYNVASDLVGGVEVTFSEAE
ncbi:DUF3566 domain-containing protein [Sphaerisporangium sp. NPDC005289]|uniref:DUF3566 domain-containing protein n=1 Tax=Sphaerisporangium sp. NPDC005289 TaxID=3155247 RepID=UPI0033AE017C